ncbi:hypothetical protein JHK87_056506 [Glycine soja]|nr:hypothetical protein JHK87_056506 [Glycine soja]
MRVKDHTTPKKNHRTVVSEMSKIEVDARMNLWSKPFDIDDEVNSFRKSNLEIVRMKDHTTPRKSHWTVVSETAKTEADARINLGSKHFELLVRGKGVEVGLGEELEENMVAKDVSESDRGDLVTGEVVVGGKIGVKDDENAKGGVV